MSYQVLARKWRPKTFDKLVGQHHVVQALTNGLDQDRLHHAFLFTGTRGVGKTTIARILAKCLNCDQGVSSTPCGECSSCVDIDEGRFIDMLEIDAASRTKVDDTRELLESVQFTPTRGRYKIYIIDEVHMLSTSSFNALLKTLEEPPPHVKFVLATTDPQKIPVTILSRCLRFNLTRLLPDQIEDYLAGLLTAENIEYEKDALALLARAADGSMRDGLSIMDQAISHGAGSLSYSGVKDMLGVVEHERVATIIRALTEGDAQAILDVVEILVAQSRDLESVLIDLAEYMHRIVLVQCVPDYQDRERSDWESIVELAGQITAEDAQLYYQIAIKGRQDLSLAPDPRTGLEMTLLRMLAFRPVDAAASTAPVSVPPVPAKMSGEPDVSKSGEETVRSGELSLAKERLADESRAPTVVEPHDSPRPEPVLMSETEPLGKEWINLLGRLDLTGQVRELAQNVQLDSASEDQWDFVISPSLRHLGSKGCIDRLENAISQQMGYRVSVNLADSKSSSLLTAAELREQGSRERMSEAEKMLEQDRTVRALKDQMGAVIHKDSIQPLQ
jgi:DNA polymerase-3 subunit gamma/tau